MIIQAEDLAGMGSSYVNSQDAEYKQKHSHQKVILTDEQWESVTKIFHQLGKETKYHGYVMLYCNRISVYVYVHCITYIANQLFRHRRRLLLLLFLSFTSQYD